MTEYCTLPLFNLKPAKARRTDPETSHIAAAKYQHSGRPTKDAVRVLKAIKDNPGSTAKELDARERWELVAHKHIYKLLDLECIARPSRKRCEATGSVALQCYITEHGIWVLDNG